jgi:hypothetical protein
MSFSSKGKTDGGVRITITREGNSGVPVAKVVKDDIPLAIVIHKSNDKKC